MSKLEVDAIEPQSGTTLTIGASGDTINLASGATITDFTSTGIDDNATSTAITIDSSENVGIGTSSPSVKLHVKKLDEALRLQSDTVDSALYQTLYNSAGTRRMYQGYAGASTSNYTLNNEENGAIILATNNAERMRIDSSGNVGIGTSSPNEELSTLGNVNIGNNDSSNPLSYLRFGATQYGVADIRPTDEGAHKVGLDFYTDGTGDVTINPTFAMRISSSGNVGIGTSSPDSKLRVDDTVNQTILAGVNSNSSFSTNGVFLQLSRNTTNNSFYAMSYYNDGAGSYKFRVADSGNVTNTNNSYGAISDEKLKENIIDATPKLEKLKQVRIVNFNFINDSQKQIGVIAQELENIFPSMVEESPDKDEDGKDLNTTTKQVKYSVFVPILIKALQEQQTKIEELEARITTLENA